MKQTALDYAHYNLWANERLVRLFQSGDQAIVEQEIISSFPSIRLTLLHLWSVEDIWLERLRGVSPAAFLAATFTGTTEDIYRGLLEKSSEIIRFVEARDEAYFSTPITFGLLTASGGFTHTPSQMLQHLVNHQSSHRGQLITMGRQAGVQDFPRTDYIIWLREQGG